MTIASTSALLAITLASLVAVAEARAETPGERCDRLASHPGDPRRNPAFSGVATGDIDVVAAMSACLQATTSEPANARFHYQLGRAYFDGSNTDGAFAEFSTAAQSDYPVAKGALGYFYDAGIGTRADKTKALALALEAASENVGFAAHNAAVMLREGDGAPKDYPKSLALFRKAVSLGYDQSLVDIGFAYDNGYGVPVDYAEAMAWYQRAADKQISEAYNNIGNLYENGNGVAQDDAQALAWYAKAEAQGYTLAYMNIANLIDHAKGQAADPARAARLVLKAFDEGGKGDDVNEIAWTPQFWIAMRAELIAAGRMSAAQDAASEAETKAAFDAMLDG